MLIAALALPCTAVEFGAVQGNDSTIGFSAKQMGVTMPGKFRKFEARLAFDPDRIDSAQVTLDVDLASIDTGTRESDREVASKTWFDTKDYPVAHFVSSSFKALPDKRYEVAGQLSIKGRTQPVSAPVKVTVNGNSAVFDGAFTIRRGDFGIGEGEWADYSVVANEVQISFHIVARSPS
jgi:polyisoprenoid-binding protein YceI